MNFNSLSSESTLQYQVIQRNTEKISSFKAGNIFKIIENSNFFEMINVLPYDIIDFKDEIILGSGSFATVYFSYNIFKNKFCALKVHQNISETEMHSIQNEYTIQNKLNSKFNTYFLNLIDDVYVVQKDHQTYSAYAGMERGITTLDEYLEKRCLGIEEFQCLYHEILDSILKMHSLHIAHRDIKPKNIFYLSRKKWVLSDFGCATIYQNKKEIHKIVGTKSYLPKNIRNKIQFSFEHIEMEMDLFQNDIYAFTLTMLQAYIKNSNIIDLQNMIDQSNWNNIQDDSLSYLFQIYQKPYSYIKQHILLNLQHVEISSKFVEYQLKLTQFKFLQSFYSQNKVEKQIKLMNYDMSLRYSLQNIQLNEILELHSKNGQFFTKSEKKLFEEFVKQIPLVKNQFQLMDEIKYQEIFQITQRIQKWQFDNINFYYMRKGNFSQQIQCCQEFEKFSEKHLFDVKLIQLDQLFFTGQEQHAFNMIQELDQISYQLTQTQSLILKIYQSIQNKTWLEQAYSLQTCLKISNFQTMNLQYLLLMINFYNWVIQDKILPCQNFEEPLSDEIELVFQGQIYNQYKITSTRFGVQECQINQLIDQLYARGADCFGIFQIFYNLISASIKDENHQLIKDLHQKLITFIESNKQLNHLLWLILLNYSVYCYKQQNYVESLQYQLRALDSVKFDDNEKRVPINMQIYKSLLKQFKYQKAQKVFTQLLNNLNQNSRNLRQVFLKRLLQATFILVIQGNFVDLQYSAKLARSIFQMDNDIKIQNLLYKFEWGVLLDFENQELLINQFNSVMINQSLNSTLNDIDLLHCIKSIKLTSKKQSKQSVQAQNIYFDYQEKFAQDLIIFQDLYKLNQTDALNTNSEISELAKNKQNGIINLKKAEKMILSLIYFT